MSIIVRTNEPVQAAESAKAPEAKEQASKGATHSAPEEKSSEQNASSESEPEETEEVESDESEDKESEGDSEELKDENKDDGKDKPKKKSGFQRRIDKLNSRLTAREQEIEYWKQEAMKRATDSKAAPQVETKQAEADAGKPKPDDFDTHGAYVEALTDWKTEQKLKERDQKLERSKLETEQAKLVQTYAERMQAFAKKVEDFQEVIDEVEDIPLSPVVRDIILSSENGPELAYEMAKNRDEYARICKLGPIAAAREVGKIESRIAAKSSEATKEIKKVTKAPKPLAPVNAGSATVKKSLSDPNLSQREYEQLRLEQMKKRRQA